MNTSNDIKNTGNNKLDAVVSKMKGSSAYASSGTNGQVPPPPLTSSTSKENNKSADANEALRKAIQINERSNDLGSGALQNLGKQKEIIQGSINTVDETSTNLRDSRRILRDMKWQYWKDRLGKALVIACLLIIIVLIVYIKWLRKRGS